MVKGLATSTVNFYGNFTQYLSEPDVVTLSVLETLGVGSGWGWGRGVIWSCKRCFGNQKTP